MDERNLTITDEKKTNGWAIAGLICSIVLGGLLGLIFSIIGLTAVKKCHSGKGIAISGIVISIIKMILVVVLIVGFVLLFNTIKNSPEFIENFCTEIETMKETACTKNEDGTYDCIFATCNYNNSKENDEPKNEEPNHENTEVKKEYSNAYLETIAQYKNKENYYYSLVYIDNDDTPELIVDNEGYFLYIYKFVNNKAVAIKDNLDESELGYGTHGREYSYAPKKGIIHTMVTDYDEENKIIENVDEYYYLNNLKLEGPKYSNKCFDENEKEVPCSNPSTLNEDEIKGLQFESLHGKKTYTEIEKELK